MSSSLGTNDKRQKIDQDENEDYWFPSDVLDYLKSEGITVISYLDRGTYSRVFKAKSDSDEIAIKEIDLNDCDVENEKQISMFVRHKHIIRTQRVIQMDDRYLFLVLDFAEGGNFTNLIEDGKIGEVDQVQKYFLQIVEAIQYLHENGIVHRDLKTDNVLLSKGVVKITDFGLSELAIDEDNNVILFKNYCGTPEYSSPENLICSIKRIPFNPFISETFSLGVILYQMLTSEFPFGNGPELRTLQGKKRQYKKLMEEEWKLTKEFKEDSELYSVMKQMLNPNPDSRIRVSQIPFHPWFDDN